MRSYTKLVDEKIQKLVDESDIIRLEDFKKARLIADAIFKVHGLKFAPTAVYHESKIQRQKAQRTTQDI